jgi:hypothetical protein
MEECAMVQNVQFGHLTSGCACRPRNDSAGATTRVGLASAERDVTGSLSVVTKEGDTVTLSASYEGTFTYADMRRDHSRLRVASAEVSRSFSLQVEGELSDQELREVRQVVKRFMHDLSEMVRGGQPLIADVTAVRARTLESISATTSTHDTLTAVAITNRPLPTPVPVIPVAGDGTQYSPAQRAPLAGEDADSAPAPAPMIPFSARGFVHAMPVVPSILTLDVAPVRS